MFRIGNQTSCYSQNIFDPFEFAINVGFESFEWFFDKNSDGGGLDISMTDSSFRRSIRQRAAEAGISQSVHAPCNFNIFSSSGIKEFIAIVNFAIDINAKIIVLHFDSSFDAKNLISNIKSIENYFKGKDITLVFENTPLSGPDEFNRFFENISTYNEYNGFKIGMAFDLGHANLYQGFNNNYVEYLNALKDYVPIYHLHFHENAGQSDSHNTLFTCHSKYDDSGIRAVIRNLIQRKFIGSIIFEQWPHPPSLLIEAQIRLKKIIKEEKSKLFNE